MTPRLWWRLAVIAAALYALYDLGPEILPDISREAHRMIVLVLAVALAISGSASLAQRREEREERDLLDAPTQQLAPVVARVTVVHAEPRTSGGIDPEVVAAARRLARRLHRDE